MKYIAIFFISLCCFPANLHAQDSEKDFVQLSEPVKQTDSYRVFGSMFDKNIPSVELDSLIEHSSRYKNQTVTTEGAISQVCQKKGCFFMLKSGDQKARISFKDYSFFIPTNTAGTKIKLNGSFEVKTITEKDAKHYAEDAGEDPNKITGPQKEYALVATSVIIYTE